MNAMKYKKSLIIPIINNCTGADAIAKELFQKGVHTLIDTVNWGSEYPLKPLSTAALGHDGLKLYILFTINATETRAMVTDDLGPVADDTCFEIFVKHPGNPRYWNFEFNTLGKANISSRIERKNATCFTPSELAMIERYGSTTAPHSTTITNNKECHWLLVSIDLSLIGLDRITHPTLLEGNIYSCASAINNPYYLSWSPIYTEKPDFHRPEFFGYMILE